MTAQTNAIIRGVGSNKQVGGGGGGGGATKNRLVLKTPACSSPRGVWGHAPPENFEILCITRCFLRHFGALKF